MLRIFFRIFSSHELFSSFVAFAAVFDCAHVHYDGNNLGYQPANNKWRISEGIFSVSNDFLNVYCILCIPLQNFLDYLVRLIFGPKSGHFSMILSVGCKLIMG